MSELNEMEMTDDEVTELLVNNVIDKATTPVTNRVQYIKCRECYITFDIKSAHDRDKLLDHLVLHPDVDVMYCDHNYEWKKCIDTDSINESEITEINDNDTKTFHSSSSSERMNRETALNKYCENDNELLILCAEYGENLMISHLIENKADVNARNSLALIKSIENTHYEITKMLVKAGASIPDKYGTIVNSLM